jgi:hypothetical protein
VGGRQWSQKSGTARARRIEMVAKVWLVVAAAWSAATAVASSAGTPLYGNHTLEPFQAALAQAAGAGSLVPENLCGGALGWDGTCFGEYLWVSCELGVCCNAAAVGLVLNCNEPFGSYMFTTGGYNVSLTCWSSVTDCSGAPTWRVNNPAEECLLVPTSSVIFDANAIELGTAAC